MLNGLKLPFRAENEAEKGGNGFVGQKKKRVAKKIQEERKNIISRRSIIRRTALRLLPCFDLTMYTCD